MTESENGIDERKVLKVPSQENDIDLEQPVEQDASFEMNDEDVSSQISDDNVQQNQFDTNFDAGVEADEETDPKRYIQQLAGKLSQSLRSYNSELPSPDVDLSKYVMGMVNKQALKGMNDADVKDVLSKIKSDEDNDDSMNINDGGDASVNSENDDNEEPIDNFVEQNESLKRDKINELFQNIISDNDKDNNNNDDIHKPIQNIGYRRKPFTSPNFE